MFTRSINEKVSSAYVILTDSIGYEPSEYYGDIVDIKESIQAHKLKHHSILEQFCYKYNIPMTCDNYLDELASRINFDDLCDYLPYVFDIDGRHDRIFISKPDPRLESKYHTHIDCNLNYLKHIIEKKTLQDYTTCQQEFARLMKDSTTFNYKIANLRNVILTLNEFNYFIAEHTSFIKIIKSRFEQITVYAEEYNKVVALNRILNKFSTFKTLMKENDSSYIIAQGITKLELTKEVFNKIIDDFIRDIRYLRHWSINVTSDIKTLTAQEDNSSSKDHVEKSTNTLVQSEVKDKNFIKRAKIESIKTTLEAFKSHYENLSNIIDQLAIELETLYTLSALE